MIGVYFSGTGNTKYCLEKFIELYNANADILPLEDTATRKEIKLHQEIIFAYPIYYSNLPKIVRDFICENSEIWQGKRIFIIATMGLFSGDGTGISARLFKKYGAKIWGGLHLKMPDCICDVKTLKRSAKENIQLVAKAEEQIKYAVDNLKIGIPTKSGLGILCHVAGFLGQRLWFFRKTQSYSNRVHIDINTCVKCGNCVKICPMRNLTLSDNKVMTRGCCTLCYRCATQCTQKAITILGEKVIFQNSIDDYI